MERLKLNNNCKKILKSLSINKALNNEEQYSEDINLLIVMKLISATKLIGGDYCAAQLTDLGRAYIHWNPKLKNPSIWDDKKYWITTIISLSALALSLFAITK